MSKRKVLLIGATGGIGNATLEKLYEEGVYEIFATSTRKEALDEIAAEFPEIHPILFDHTARTEKELIEQVGAGIDSVVIASGITSDALCMRLSDDLWDKTIEVNLSSTFRILKHAFRKMNTGSSIVLVSSVVARMGNAGQVAYAASKGGLEAMAKTLAREWAVKDITVNSIAPGFVATKMTQDFDHEALAKHIPSGRFGKPEEMAAAISYLIGPNARYMTGHTLELNGGMWMV